MCPCPEICALRIGGCLIKVPPKRRICPPHDVRGSLGSWRLPNLPSLGAVGTGNLPWALHFRSSTSSLAAWEHPPGYEAV